MRVWPVSEGGSIDQAAGQELQGHTGDRRLSPRLCLRRQDLEGVGSL